MRIKQTNNKVNEDLEILFHLPKVLQHFLSCESTTGFVWNKPQTEPEHSFITSAKEQFSHAWVASAAHW